MRIHAFVAMSLAWLALPPGTQAQQADARDFELGYFAPNNSVAINIYARHESAEKPRNYTATSGFFRATHIIKRGDWVFVPFDFLLPVTNLTVYNQIPNTPLSGTLHTAGIGDLIWIPTIGTGIEQDATLHTHTWFALTPYVFAPTGNYSARRLVNTGSNRWQFRPQITVGQRFLRAITVEAFGNLGLYTKNREYRVLGQGMDRELSQKPSFGAALLTAVDLAPTFILSASYYFSKNGRQEVDGGRLGSPIPEKQTIHTLRLGMGIRVEKQTQLLFQLNQDVKTHGGAPISRGFFVRVTHLFFPPPKPQSRPVIEGAPPDAAPVHPG